jgi:hypothetical protein
MLHRSAPGVALTDALTPASLRAQRVRQFASFNAQEARYQFLGQGQIADVPIARSAKKRKAEQQGGQQKSFCGHPEKKA